MKTGTVPLMLLSLLLVGAGCGPSMTTSATTPAAPVTQASAPAPTAAPSPAPAPSAALQKCDKLTNNKQPWLPALQKALGPTGQEMTAGEGSYCLSSDEKTAFVIIAGEYCEGPAIYQFDIASSGIRKAGLNGHGRGCLASPTDFGTTDGKLAHLLSHGGDGGCQSDMYFDYDIAANSVELKKESSKCEGDTSATTTNY